MSMLKKMSMLKPNFEEADGLGIRVLHNTLLT